jgi:hypothetical protein
MSFVVAQIRAEIFSIPQCNLCALFSVGATEVNAQCQMQDEFRVPGDSPWQSVRLGFGAILLVLSGLGLFLIDTSMHPGTAQSAIIHSP